MRHALLGLALLISLSSTAHANSPDVHFKLIAWNRDQTAAILERVASEEGGRDRSYVIITTTDEGWPAVTMLVSSTSGSEELQKPKDCKATASTFREHVIALQFKTVAIRVERCSAAARDLVRAPAIAQPSAPRSKLQRAAAEVVSPGYRDSAVRNNKDCDNEEGDVLDVAVGKGMSLVFATSMCTSPVNMQVSAVLPKSGAYKLGAVAS